MIKKFALLASLALSTVAFGDTGIFGSDIGLTSNLFNSGGNTFFEATLLGDGRHAPLAGAFVTLPVTLDTSGFNGLNLGTFNPGAGDTLILIGGETLTFKNGGTGATGTDVTGTFLNYQIDSGGFTAISLGFNEDNVNTAPGDQRWAATNNSVDLLNALSPGTHQLTFFTSGSTNGSSGIFDSNGGANFTATFTIAAVPEPSSFALLAGPAILGAWFFVRRRRA